MLEPVWNRRQIARIEITMGETFGVETRGKFYEGVGALRDVVQNHLLQVVSLLAMEPPVSEDADALRDEHTKVLRATRVVDPRRSCADSTTGYLRRGRRRARLRHRDLRGARARHRHVAVGGRAVPHPGRQGRCR